MPSNKNKAKSKAEKERRALVTAAKDHAQTIMAHNMGCTRHDQPPSNKFRIVGSPIHIPAFNKEIMTNLTVIDSETNQPLQRFKPTSYKKQTAANKSAGKDLELFTKALQKHDQMKSRGNIHLGLWAERGNVKINFITHTSKNEFGVNCKRSCA
ncbi:hypothetical protein NDA11_003397 [Ustilago hordei]|uniref:Uncharacterized protein n=1 Tax=Ustilago hordei TaxID=120017 RepID=I2FNU1_USTHO|nr:uncharacterized protein UHO2_07120 [Ustilago hordei]KAJ1039539.1 hypothetical protein NDA10_002623 [Ustilago hordei]KAJ1570185.1 hypothetical protein NDA12_002460 [Ustilago hordei]KAJ1572155.1 hypothetical protein NDA15_006114 [Ustilago hordei]KAJ1574276.1 hypothetical protein NDA11_003397 [Ustilago hordei]KAJ1594597.1 hypothetical protein NDA14_003465 [Ustilago hordei]